MTAIEIKPVTILLGDTGTGKTTFLNAHSINLMDKCKQSSIEEMFASFDVEEKLFCVKWINEAFPVHINLDDSFNLKTFNFNHIPRLISELSYGGTRLLKFLLQLYKETRSRSPIVVGWENPENGLDNSLQLHFILDIVNLVSAHDNIKFVIETHSSTFVDCVGFLVEKKDIDFLDAIVYLFEIDEMRYRRTQETIRFKEDGKLNVDYVETGFNPIRVKR